MSADPVTRLNEALEGRYRIERELGEGGMATVYLADDLKHERKVALKVLKPELAAVVGAERFLAEIKTTANLQHPHILPLFDSGAADGFLFYVMPYVEGESLRDRLDRDKQLPVDEAVRIATDVAEALHAAHERGVIHRDIKPANILLSNGRPLVADFGIALAVSTAGGGRLTETGLSMGTPYYMSPEQASADREPSAASDVYSLGCVAYEMLVGEPPYTGGSAQAVLAKILMGHAPAPTATRPAIPPNVDAAIRKALEKLPADRFTGTHDFARALADPTFTHGEVAVAAVPSGSTPWRAVSLVLAVLLVLTSAVAGRSLLAPRDPEPSPPFRAEVTSAVARLAGGSRRLAISRDGATLVVAGVAQGAPLDPRSRLLFVRRADDPEFRPIPGTEGASLPSISPDGAWVVFEVDLSLKKVQIAGGPVLPVVVGGFAPHWYAQDEIVFQRPGGGAYRVSPAGGEATLLAEGHSLLPVMLPGGRAFLAIGPDGGPDGVYLTELGSGESRLIAQGATDGRYVPTGHIIYGDPTLQSVMAVPFDLEALEVTGSPVPVLQGVAMGTGGGLPGMSLAVSDNGLLVHGISGQSAGGVERFTWVHLDGSTEDLALDIPQGQVRAPRISPDGTRVAYQAEDGIFVFVFDTGERIRVTRDLPAEIPVWSPDGSTLYFSTAEGTWYRTASDGSTDAEEISPESMGGPMIAMSPDGQWIVADDRSTSGAPDIFTVQLGEEPLTARPYLRADWHEEKGVLSPDGKWLAYVSNEDGGHVVYLRSFPEPGPKIRVSILGGDPAVWAPDGSALYYRDGYGGVRARDVRLGETVELGEERTLFSLPGARSDFQTRIYDIHPDGDRFLFLTTGDVETRTDSERNALVVVVNWFEELRRRMEGG